jgi:zinc transport system substrate-binding protein
MDIFFMDRKPVPKRVTGLTIVLLFGLSSFSFAQVRFATSIPPFKAILQRVVGEKGGVIAILPPGASPHTFEARPKDFFQVASATALFYGSEQLDKWVLTFKNDNKISLLQMLPVPDRLELRGFYGKNKGRPLGVDPHFWTSPHAVKSILPGLTKELIAIDPAGKAVYEKNAKAFAMSLDSLSAVVAKMMAKINGTPVMMSHPSFQYFFKEFGFHLAGVIEVLPGTEPTAREVKEIIETAKKENVRVIFIDPQHSSRPAELIRESTGIKLCELNPLGGIEGRMSYEEIILYNARKIVEALQ